MTVVAGAFKTACITAAGPTQDITSADMGSEVPKCAILAMTLGVTNNAAATGALFSIGITDGTNSRVVCASSENTGAASNSSNWCRPGSVILILNQTTGAIIAQANVVSFIAGGIRISWDVVTYALPAAAYQIHGLFFGGSALQAKVTNATSDGTPLGGTNVTGVGFRPDAMFCIGATRGFDDVSRQHAAVSLGIFAIDHAEPPNLEQAATIWRDTTALNPTQELARSVSDRIYQNFQTSSGTLGSGLEVISVGPDGFRTQDKDGTSSSYAVGCLCLNFGSGVNHAILNFQTPTAASSVSYPIPFQIQAAIFLPQLVPTLGVTETGGNAGAQGIGFVSNSVQAGLSVSANDNVVAATRSRADARMLEMQETDTTLGYRGNYDGSVFGNLEVTYSNVTATASQVWALIIGETPPGPTLTASSLVLSAPAIAMQVDELRLPAPTQLVLSAPAIETSVASIVHLTLLPQPSQLVLSSPQRGVFVEAGQPSTFRGRIGSSGIVAGQIGFGGIVKGRISYGQP